MTHQIGAVQGAASENTSHHSAAPTVRSAAGNGATGVPSSGRRMSCCSGHMGLCDHLVEEGHIAMIYLPRGKKALVAALASKKKDILMSCVLGASCKGSPFTILYRIIFLMRT